MVKKSNRTSMPPTSLLTSLDSKNKSLSLDFENVQSSRGASARETVTPTEANAKPSSVKRFARVQQLKNGQKYMYIRFGWIFCRFVRTLNAAAAPDHRVFVVWLESFEDAANFPLGALQRDE